MILRRGFLAGCLAVLAAPLGLLRGKKKPPRVVYVDDGWNFVVYGKGIPHDYGPPGWRQDDLSGRRGVGLGQAHNLAKSGATPGPTTSGHEVAMQGTPSDPEVRVDHRK